jgi:3-deoxy-D-manno-octulosonic-acid transferase
MFNFADATANARAAGAALEVADAAALVEALRDLFANPSRRAAIAQAAREFHAAHRGAADRLWQWLAPQLDASCRTARVSSARD